MYSVKLELEKAAVPEKDIGAFVLRLQDSRSRTITRVYAVKILPIGGNWFVRIWTQYL